jgi:hypothetical protein
MQSYNLPGLYVGLDYHDEQFINRTLNDSGK